MNTLANPLPPVSRDPLFRRGGPSRLRAVGSRFVLAVGFAVSAAFAHAAGREITIQAPASAPAGSTVNITVTASTDAGGGEQIGFFNAEYSVDGGKTWTGFSYATNQGGAASHTATFKAGAADTTAQVRAMVAFRGGKAGDVDYTGKAIDWEKGWNKWQQPPAKLVTIKVVAK